MKEKEFLPSSSIVLSDIITPFTTFAFIQLNVLHFSLCLQLIFSSNLEIKDTTESFKMSVSTTEWMIPSRPTTQ